MHHDFLFALSWYHPGAALRSIADQAATGVAFALHVTKAKSPRDICHLVLHCTIRRFALKHAALVESQGVSSRPVVIVPP
jgi:hypothetical protein